MPLKKTNRVKSKHNTNRNTKRIRENKIHRENKISKKGNISNQKRADIVKHFMELLVMIKLYHWKTHSFAQHKATDQLYADLNEHIDKFVEVLLGKNGTRVYMLEKYMRMYDLNTKAELREHVFEFRTFLVDMNKVLDLKKDSDLLSIRDDILVDLNQFLYLLTFDK